MYNLKEVVRNVEYFSIQQSNFIFKNSVNIQLNEKKLPVDYKYYGYLNPNFIQYGKYEKHYLENLATGQIIETPQVLFSKGFNNISAFYTTNYIYDKTIKRSRSDFFKFDISTGISTKILSNSPDILIFSNVSNLFFWFPKTTLKSLSLLTGEYEWEVDLGEYGEIRKIIGVHEGKLWVSCQFTIVAVSTLSGEVLHIFKEPTHIAYQDGDLQYFRGIDAQLDETSGLLYGIEHETYYEIDLHTLQFTYWIFTNTSNQLKCNSPHSHCKAYFVNEIFFIDKMNATIGSFNRDLKEWSIEYSFPDRLIIDMPDLEAVTVGFMNDIQVGNNKLYVLTSEGFLFIFEKQETG